MKTITSAVVALLVLTAIAASVNAVDAKNRAYPVVTHTYYS